MWDRGASHSAVARRVGEIKIVCGWRWNFAAHRHDECESAREFYRKSRHCAAVRIFANSGMPIRIQLVGPRWQE